MVFVLYSGTIQLQLERHLKLTRLPATISPKSNTAFLHEMFYFFYNLFITDHVCDWFIQSKDSIIKVNSWCNDHSFEFYITLGENNIGNTH